MHNFYYTNLQKKCFKYLNIFNPNPIIFIIGPITIGGKVLLIQLLPTSPIINETIIYLLIGKLFPLQNLNLLGWTKYL